MTGDEIRQAFLEFFRDKGHKILPSSSLIPYKDPTLLLTSAGMVQIKPYFLGLEAPPSPRLASCQKCFRATDIDSVGDSKHLTFFEMLGNFSVGDYFKKEAISWAWEFVTKYLKLPKERLWITIYLDDDEAFNYWQQIGIPAERILRFGEEDNFWGPVGDSGPCGPCSEIHYDLGEEFGCGRPECKPNCECGRFSEIWNLVFTQYNQGSDGKRTPLPKPNIDTGMGLERTAAATQGKPSPYETELFSPLVKQVCQLASRNYGEDENTDRAIRVIAEHGRGIVFLIADGVMPSNEGRGYVLRRILRRASLFGRRLGLDRPFLGEMAEIVVNKMSRIYPEIVTSRNLVTEVIGTEEERFIAALDAGLNLVEKLVDEALHQGKKWLQGHEIFPLYDTYGFPPELTAEIAREKGLSIDWEGFQAEMERQQERARAANKMKILWKHGNTTTIIIPSTDVCFVGYETTASESKILELTVREKLVESASQGDEVAIVLDKTPFYGEMGGQVGDTGETSSQKGKVDITNTLRTPFDTIVHQGRVIEGSISVGDDVEAKVDEKRRLDIARNHTATHLLQFALRQVLGNHIEQRGSLVEPERLRFDFSHFSTITEEQLMEIQKQVNEKARQNLPVKAKKDIPYGQAITEGALAFFEEKYGATVRVIEIGEPPISKELCGGTHVKSTGEIGLFFITNESSIGTGLHRIQAVTGRAAESLVERHFSDLQNIAKEVESPLEEVHGKVKTLLSELETEHRRTLWLERELSRKVAESLLEQVEKVDGVTVLAAKVPPLTMLVLREMGDILRDKLKSAIVVLATVYDNRPNFVAMVTPDLAAKGFHAGDIVKEIAKVTGGGGGGKATMAQAGGKDIAKLDEALISVKSVIAKQISPYSMKED
ncbi:MAG: alanine--tRNA ligase [Dehalococcoidia bacterium]|nr:alanine--tRNA ligase [Dehalococcoidia bacterium]